MFSLPPESHATAALAADRITASLLVMSTSLLAFSYAGERMPWLTTHITMPMILASGWALGYLVEHIDWNLRGAAKDGWLGCFAWCSCSPLAACSVRCLVLCRPSRAKTWRSCKPPAPFFGRTWLPWSWGGLVFLLKDWRPRTFLKTLLLLCFGVMSVFTFRAAYRVVYINYDNAKEYLVYAHSTRDMKDVLEQVETISKRLYGDKSIAVAYDNDALYPFWWYLRDYPNRVWFGDNITQDLRDSPVILAGSANFAKISNRWCAKITSCTSTSACGGQWRRYRNQSFASVAGNAEKPGRCALPCGKFGSIGITRDTQR